MSPVLVLFLLGEALLWLAGETTSIDKVVLRHQGSNQPAAYLPAFVGQQFAKFHQTRIDRTRPDLLVVGSSRVMRFREEMFLPETRFYNSGRLVSSVSHLERLVDSLPPGYAPRTVLIGIDSWWLALDPLTDAAISAQPTQDDTTLFEAHVCGLRRLAQAIGDGKVTLDLVGRMLRGDDAGVKRYGFLAWTEGGFYNDGSYRDLELGIQSLPGSPRPTIEPPKKIFADRTSVDPELFRRLMTALSRLDQRGTRIIGFAPPFCASTREVFARDPVQASYFKDFQRQIGQAFLDKSWRYYDGTDLSELGLDDRYMEDSHHPMETYLVNLLLKLAHDAEVCAALSVSPDYLKSLLADPGTTTWYPAYSSQREVIQLSGITPVGRSGVPKL